MERKTINNGAVTELKSGAKTEAKERFIGGVMLMSLSTFICKLIGLIFKLPMLTYVGIQGMAYFSASYHIYLLLNTLSTAGLPVALSMMISGSRVKGRRENIKRIFRISLTVFFVLGVLGFSALFFGADYFAEWIGMPDAAPSIKAIAPTLFFICISSAFRGYFQGHEIMAPTAVSQLMESVGKLSLGILFASIALSSGAGPSYTAAAAIAGLSVGVGISVVYLIIRKMIFPRTERYKEFPRLDSGRDSIGSIMGDLVRIALPITLSASVTSITGLADTALITKRLISGGLEESAAINAYSSYSNLAVPLFNLPPALITPLAITLVPALTASIVSCNMKREKKVFSSSFKLCVFISLPSAAGLSVFAEPILKLIFPSEKEAIMIAAPLLSILSVSVIFTCLTTVTNAILQAYGKQGLPIISMSCGAVIKIIAEYLLVGSKLGVYGAPISTFLCTLTVVTVNIFFIGKYTPHRFQPSIVWRSLAASVVSIAFAIGVYAGLECICSSNILKLFPSIITAVSLYLIFALRFGAVREEDILLLPKGQKIANLLNKIKLIK